MRPVEARKLFPFLTKVIADSANQGPRAATALTAIADWQVEIVRRADVKGFKLLPKRPRSLRDLDVERTFA